MSQPKALVSGKEPEKLDLNYRNDICAWISDLIDYAFKEQPKAVQFCFYPSDLAVTKRLNPDIQGILISGIMAEGDETPTIVVDGKTRKNAPARKDLRMVLQIAKGLGKDVSLDEVMKSFESECIKDQGYSEIRTRCITALLYLRNSGFFAQAGRMLSVWRKTFFGKANFHAKFY